MTFTISGRLVRWPSYPRTAVCLKCDLWATDSYWQFSDALWSAPLEPDRLKLVI
jgi:hypothetical protein